ncbi:hypothetical protein B296_00057153, partial [Ensete ventricosum]
QICDPPVSVYKGYLLKNEAEKCLASRGLKNAIYSLNAKDLKEDIFGILVPCPLQEPAVASPVADLPENISVITDEPVKKHLKLEYSSEQKQLSDNSMSCTLQFYGAPAGEDRHGGAGVILRTEDGSVISRLREGLGAVTPKAAQFIALIVGLKHALKRGFKQIHVQGDSQFVCMQVCIQHVFDYLFNFFLTVDGWVIWHVFHICRNLLSTSAFSPLFLPFYACKRRMDW